MYLFLIILIVISAILLCFIVLIQNSKGGGLSSGFSSSNQIMGVRKTTDFLEKTTWGLAAAIVVLSIVTSYIVPTATNTEGSAILEEAQKEEKTNPMNTPAGFETPKTGTTPAAAPAGNAAPKAAPAQTPAQPAK